VYSPEVHLTIRVSQASNSVMDFQTHNTHVFAELHGSNYTRYTAINGIRHEEHKIKRSRSGRNLYEIPSRQLKAIIICQSVNFAFNLSH